MLARLLPWGLLPFEKEVKHHYIYVVLWLYFFVLIQDVCWAKWSWWTFARIASTISLAVYIWRQQGLCIQVQCTYAQNKVSLDFCTSNKDLFSFLNLRYFGYVNIHIKDRRILDRIRSACVSYNHGWQQCETEVESSRRPTERVRCFPYTAGI